MQIIGLTVAFIVLMCSFIMYLKNRDMIEVAETILLETLRRNNEKIALITAELLSKELIKRIDSDEVLKCALDILEKYARTD